MAKIFCQNCGVQGDEGALFCGNCGAKMPPTQLKQQAQPPQQAQSPQPAPPQQWAPPPQQQWQQPPPQTQNQWQPPQQQPYGNYPQTPVQPYAPPVRKKSKKGLAIGLIVGGVVLAAVVIVLIVVLGGGGGGGSVLTKYDAEDVIGSYSGTIKINSVKYNKGFSDYAKENGLDLDELDKMNGSVSDCELYLGSDYINIEADDPIIFGDDSIELENIKLVKGVAKGTEKEDYDEGGYDEMVYEVTLHKGKDSEYSLYGVITMTGKMTFDGKEASYSIKMTFDCESK